MATIEGRGENSNITNQKLNLDYYSQLILLLPLFWLITGKQ